VPGGHRSVTWGYLRILHLEPVGFEQPLGRTPLPGEHSWSPSYFAAPCGGAPLPVIKEYTEQQKRPG
jgi:REP element-mobilizing transposase RayT